MFLKHPAWLWYKKHDKAKLPPVDDNLQDLFDSGNLFESYAEQIFDNATKLGFDGYDEYLSLPERTKNAIKDGTSTILQGRFESDGITCICDVVQIIDSKTVDLTEIKASTKAKEEHEFDLAFQLVVLETCGYEVRNISVAHVNSDYVREGEVDPKGMTTIVDVTEKVKAKRDNTRKYIEQTKKVAAQSKCPDTSPARARLGAFGEWLSIYKLHNQVDPGSIFDLIGINAQTVEFLEKEGVTQLVDIPENFDLKPKQAMQVEATRNGTPTIHEDKIKEFIGDFKFPLYFLDYETMMSVVPYFDGMRPYKQYPFQYSLHMLDSPDAELRHVEYLHTENSNPVEALSRSLQANIGSEGSIVTWNMSFEKGCNTLMGRMYPEFEEFYKDVNERIVDLMIPFWNGWYVHKDFKGSASIKKVLPVLVPGLSHSELDVQDGASAQRIWMQTVLDGKNTTERETILKNLIDYCELDTLAMVEIWKVLML